MRYKLVQTFPYPRKSPPKFEGIEFNSKKEFEIFFREKINGEGWLDWRMDVTFMTKRPDECQYSLVPIQKRD